MNFFRPIVFSVLLTLMNFCPASPINLKLTSSQDATNLALIRKNIDNIDTQLVKLIGLRMKYVKRVGELKWGKLPVHDQNREEEIMRRVACQAVKEGYPASIAIAIFSTLLIQSNLYQAAQQKQLDLEKKTPVRTRHLGSVDISFW